MSELKRNLAHAGWRESHFELSSKHYCIRLQNQKTKFRGLTKVAINKPYQM